MLGSDTWDLYSASVIYLNIIHYWGIRGFDDNMFMIEFSQLLLRNIHPYYEQRYSVDETVRVFDEFFYTNTSEKNIKGVINNVEDNFDVIRNSVVAEKIKLQKLKNNITL